MSYKYILSREEVALFLHCSVAQIHNYRKQGLIAHKNGDMVWYLLPDVLRWIRSQPATGIGNAETEEDAQNTPLVSSSHSTSHGVNTTKRK